MKWMDPLSATCSSCGAEDKYSVETLRSLTATCISCGYRLASVGKDMINAEKNNSAFIQTTYCILELESLLNINLEETDEIEMPENLTIERLISLSEQKLKKVILVHEVLEIVLNKMLKNRKGPFDDKEKIWDLFLKDLNFYEI
ncbi:MAG: hypothetical protein GY793_07465 [Proteobacteria bacterium]|nr:hypothetical protein [Pseudomonadota bacterium]